MRALENFINHRKNLEIELKLFVDLYIGNEPHVITALAEKIDHMCNHIGSPSSVPEMLESIVNGKTKNWISRWDIVSKRLPKNLHTAVIEKLRTSENEIISGHFRWDWKGYKANRETRDYIKSFFIDKDIDLLRLNQKNNSFQRFKIKSYTAVNYPNGECAVINIVTTNNNNYTYHYYPKDDIVSANFNVVGNPITEKERIWVKKILLNKFPLLNNI